MRRLARYRLAWLAGAACVLALLATPKAAWALDCSAAIRTAGHQQRLTANCTTSATVIIPGGVTSFDGHGHTITAVDPMGGAFGASPDSNGTNGAVMEVFDHAPVTVRNLAIQANGVGASYPGCTFLIGLNLYRTAATLTNLRIQKLAHTDATCAYNYGSFGMLVGEDDGSPYSLTVTGSTIKGYEFSGLYAYGTGLDLSRLKVALRGNTIGPARSDHNYGAVNDVVLYYANAKVSGNTVTTVQSTVGGTRYYSDAFYLFDLDRGSSLSGNRLAGNADIAIDVWYGAGVNIVGNLILNQGQDSISPSHIGVDLYQPDGANLVTLNAIQCFATPVAENYEAVSPGTFGPNLVSNGNCPQGAGPVSQTATARPPHHPPLPR